MTIVLRDPGQSNVCPDYIVFLTTSGNFVGNLSPKVKKLVFRLVRRINRCCADLSSRG